MNSFGFFLGDELEILRYVKFWCDLVFLIWLSASNVHTVYAVGDFQLSGATRGCEMRLLDVKLHK